MVLGLIIFICRHYFAPMDITIRDCQEADFPQLLALFKEFAVFEKLSENMLNSLERMTLEKIFSAVTWAETDEKVIVGYVSYFVCNYTWVGTSLYMDDLYVSPGYRNIGIGRTPFIRSDKAGARIRMSQTPMASFKLNSSAIAFYKSIGASMDDVEQNCNLFLHDLTSSNAFTAS